MDDNHHPQDGSRVPLDQAAAFQKLRLNSLSSMARAALSFSPEAAPPDLLREVRANILNGFAQAWDRFLRSPEFGGIVRQWLDQAIRVRQAANDLLTAARHQSQAPAQEDIDALLRQIRGTETRLRDQLADLAARLEALEARLNALQPKPAEPAVAETMPCAAPASRRRSRKGRPAHP
jgi:hypothetical protein